MNVNWTILKESWATILHAFTTFGPRVFVCMLILIGIFALGKLMKAWVASRRKPIPSNPDVQFLEGALDEDAPRKPNPGYSYADFQRDLHDEKLTFDEIYEKCGGVLPQKPKEPETKPEEKKEGGPGAKSEDPDRLAQLNAWFKETGKNCVQGLVPPPPNPYPVIHKIYIRGRR